MKKNKRKLIEMNEIVIYKQDFDHIVKKNDVWIVYTKNKNHWVCEVNGVIFENNLITLKLATK